MAESLFLNQTKADLYDRPITRKIQIGEVSEVAERKSSFSYTISLPKTSRNKIIFDMLGMIGNVSRKPFEAVVADYVVDSVYLVRNGSAVIRETSEDFKVNIIDGVKSLADLLGDSKLIDLPLDELNHILTTQNYVDSYSNTEGFIYCLANFGKGVEQALKVETQAPSVFTHTLFRKIFESNGLSLNGDFFTTDQKYLNEVVTAGKGYEISDSEASSAAKGGSDSDLLEDDRTSSEFISFEDKFTMSDLSLVGASIVGGDLVFSVAGTYRIDLSIDYSTYYTLASIVAKKNGTEISSVYLDLGESLTKTASITFTVEVGDVISFYLVGSSQIEGIVDFGYFLVDYDVAFDSLLYLITGGQLIEFSDYAADMLQIDFIKDIVSRYGLVLHPIKNTDQYIFKQLEIILNDIEGAEDWTEKVSVVSNESYASGYAKINKAKYIYPSEVVVPTYDGEMLIDNENAETEKTMIQSGFEIPNTSVELSNILTYLIQIWELEDAEVLNVETPVKVMQISREDTSITAKLFDEVTGIAVTENLPFMVPLSLQYSIDNYYASFQNLIENFRKKSIIFNLSLIDIYNIDFFKLKYLKQTGRYYYLNSIQHTAGKLSKVEMIEIKEI